MARRLNGAHVLTDCAPGSSQRRLLSRVSVVEALHCGPALKQVCTLALPAPPSCPSPRAADKLNLPPLPNTAKHAVPSVPSLCRLPHVASSKAGRPTAPRRRTRSWFNRTTSWEQPAPAEDASGAGVKKAQIAWGVCVGCRGCEGRGRCGRCAEGAEGGCGGCGRCGGCGGCGGYGGCGGSPVRPLSRASAPASALHAPSPAAPLPAEGAGVQVGGEGTECAYVRR